MEADNVAMGGLMRVGSSYLLSALLFPGARNKMTHTSLLWIVFHRVLKQ